jgi:hypothetical protein
MAGRLHIEAFTDNALIWNLKIAECSVDWIPHGPRLLRAIIRALLCRFNSKDKAFIEELIQALAPDGDPLPHDSDSLRAIVKAIVGRLEPREQFYIKHILQRVAGCDQISEFDLIAPNYRWEKVYIPYLAIIAKSKPPRVGHSVHYIRLQRDLLSNYLPYNNLNSPYPTESPNERWPWVKEHWPHILSCIAGFLCYHDYNTELATDDENPNDSKGKVRYDKLSPGTVLGCTTDGQILHLILAHLHGTTPAYIEKLLKPGPFTSSLS